MWDSCSVTTRVDPNGPLGTRLDLPAPFVARDFAAVPREIALPGRRLIVDDETPVQSLRRMKIEGTHLEEPTTGLGWHGIVEVRSQRSRSSAGIQIFPPPCAVPNATVCPSTSSAATRAAHPASTAS